ncbi:transposase [Niveispirillum sp. KHB5.9]|uniref:transposase n=1 Tax=Niveispirillum sp. KHB5.9 TaxID=3400269 RepID=UPI003A876605
MAYQRLEVLTGTERRRLWSDAEKVRLVEAAFRPGIVVKEVAQRFGVHESLNWPPFGRTVRRFHDRPL